MHFNRDVKICQEAWAGRVGNNMIADSSVLVYNRMSRGRNNESAKKTYRIILSNDPHAYIPGYGLHIRAHEILYQ